MSEVLELKEKIKHLKVLFVDDEEEIRTSTLIFLEKFFDSVTVCTDGLDGLKKFEENFTEEEKFDIVITDILMPKLDGVQMVKKILEINPDVYIIFITATRDQITDEHLKTKLHVKKPVSYNSIIDIMRSIKNDFHL